MVSGTTRRSLSYLIFGETLRNGIRRSLSSPDATNISMVDQVKPLSEPDQLKVLAEILRSAFEIARHKEALKKAKQEQVAHFREQLSFIAPGMQSDILHLIEALEQSDNLEKQNYNVKLIRARLSGLGPISEH